MKPLSIPEKFLLLAHHPEKGRYVISSIHLKYGLAGAFLLEMTLHGFIEMEEKLLVLKNIPGPDRPLLKSLAGDMENAARPRRIRYWIRKLARRPVRVRKQVEDMLERNRLIRTELRHILGMIPYRKSYLVNRRIKFDLIREIRKQLFQRDAPEEEWAVLMGLMHACRMTRMLGSDRNERKTVRNKLRKIVKENPVAAGVDQTIREIQAAIVASVAASSAAAAAAGSH